MITPGPKPTSNTASPGRTSRRPATQAPQSAFMRAMITPPNRPRMPRGRPNARMKMVRIMLKGHPIHERRRPSASTSPVQGRSSSSLLLRRPLRPLDRRQRLHIFGDRIPILLAELRGVLDHPHHRAAGAVAVRCLASLEEIGDILHIPVAEPLLRDVLHPTLAFRIGTAGKALRGDDAAKKIARAVTLGTMAKAVDEIGAAIPGRRSRLIRHEQPVVEEQKFPDADIAADVEWKRQIVVTHLAFDRRQRFEI